MLYGQQMQTLKKKKKKIYNYIMFGPQPVYFKVK